jgi:hypothetical protein
MSQRQDEEEDALALSFLDVLCCGLGATIYLFLLFSIMPHLGSSGRDAGQKTGIGSKSAVGALEEEGDRVLIAPVLVQVQFPRGYNLKESDLQWEGFPEERMVQSVIPSSAASPFTVVALVPHGFNPAKGGSRNLVFSVKRKVLQPGTKEPLFVRVCVGGGRQEANLKFPDPAAGAEWVQLVDLDLFHVDKKWIHVPNP